MARTNTTRRSAILNAMAELFEKIDGGDGYKQDLSGAMFYVASVAELIPPLQHC